MRLSDRAAIVTGGANGIGRATCLVFAREGAAVIVADRDVAAGTSCMEEIVRGGGRAVFVETDVSSDAEVERLAARAAGSWGGIDVLVNSAGVAIAGSVVETDPRRWQRVLEVNLASVYRTCRAVIPHLLRRGRGAIVNVASLQGLFGWPGWAAYAASKAGIIGLTRQMAVEYADHEIRVNAVSPGGIVTDLGANTARLEPGFAAEARPASAAAPPAPTPRLRGVGRPVDVAHAVLFLASDEAAHISGQNLVVDGIASARLD